MYSPSTSKMKDEAEESWPNEDADVFKASSYKPTEDTPLMKPMAMPIHGYFLQQMLNVSKVELLITICCAVDAADKVLLPSSFQALEKDLGVGPAQLGALNMCQSLAGALALPLWGAASSRWSMRNLLVAGCLIWGVATALLASTTNYHAHLFLRVANGIGLCGVIPVSQALLVNIVPADQRGAAFGRLGAICGMMGMLTQWYAVTTQSMLFSIGPYTLHGWQMVHLQISIATFIIAVLVYFHMPKNIGKSTESNAQSSSIVDILRIPSFVLLVCQGVVGAVPWNAMAFLSLYWTAVGFTNQTAGTLMLMGGLGGVLGSFFSGYMGDAAARVNPGRGRTYVALASVALGVPVFLTLILTADASRAVLVAALFFLFQFVAGWTPAAANRPICAELVNSPEDRAKIVAWWVMLEGVSASLFGAPLVGFLSQYFGYRLDDSGSSTNAVAAMSLAKPLIGISVVCWTLCASVWVLMAHTLPADQQRAREQLKQRNIEDARYAACSEATK